LLCSDGLSDNERIEAAWANYIGLITKNIISLQSAVDSWIELANQKNGHDNVSVVLMRVKPFAETSPHEPFAERDATAPETAPETELTDASKVLLYGEGDEDIDSASATPEPAEALRNKSIPRWWVASVAVLIVLLAGLVGWWVAGQLTSSTPESDPEVVE
ncbi:MAG: serine/threonine protein phosphatase, partial [Leptolyngbya sp. SIO1D8]|nr:serine/threonine protein phosphatase [Leptolyngbya sp. SIO1D8]